MSSEKKRIIFILLLALFLNNFGMISATTLFQDDFNDNNLIGWNFAYFGDCDTCTLSLDAGTKNDSSINYDGSYYAWLEDDVAIYTQVNTTGYENINFSYCRRTSSISSADRLRIGWKTGEVSTNWTYWNELEAVQNNTWRCVNFTLNSSANNREMLIAFYLDNGEDDFGIVENVMVDGTVIIPEEENNTGSGGNETNNLPSNQTNSTGGNNTNPLIPCVDGTQKVNRNHFKQFCDVNWKCFSWSSCNNGFMTRTCKDSNNCGLIYNKPVEEAGCESEKLSEVNKEYIKLESKKSHALLDNSILIIFGITTIIFFIILIILLIRKK